MPHHLLDHLEIGKLGGIERATARITVLSRVLAVTHHLTSFAAMLHGDLCRHVRFEIIAIVNTVKPTQFQPWKWQDLERDRRRPSPYQARVQDFHYEDC